MAQGDVNEQAVPRSDLMPSSKESEMAVLSCLLTHASVWEKVVSRLVDSDFFYRENQLIFSALSALLDVGDAVDVFVLSEHLKRDGTLTQVGDITYLTHLKMLGASGEAIDSYVTAVKDKAHLRSLQLLGKELSSAVVANEDPAKLVDKVEAQIAQISEQDGVKKGGLEPLKGSISRVIDNIDEMFNGGGQTLGISTGFTELDHLILALQPADMVIVAGRPSMGKTTFAMNLVENAAMKNKTVAVFSLEMPTDSLTMRMFSSLGRINQQRLRTGRLEDEDWPKLTNAISILNDASIYIDDTPALSVSEFRARARRLHKEHGLDMIMIDYLQLMRSNGKLVNNRTDEISEISRGIKAVAKELNIPIIALSQLNRSLEQRTNKRPVMSDLRESGAIEQDADIIMFLYRDEVYNDDSPDKGKAEVIIGKQRNGPLGVVPLLFEGQFTRFHDLAIHSDVSHEYGQAGFNHADNAPPVEKTYHTKEDLPFNDASSRPEPSKALTQSSDKESGLAEIPRDPRSGSESDAMNWDDGPL